MKTCNKCKEIKSLDLFVKAKKIKSGYASCCKKCRGIQTLAYQKKNKERSAEHTKKHRLANPEKVKESFNKWAKENPEKVKKNNLDYAKNNPGKMTAKANKRYARKLKALIPITKEQLEEIKYIYIEAARITKETGIKHEVDHIIPLQSKSVCGLHVPWNLQIITKEENMKKGNRI